MSSMRGRDGGRGEVRIVIGEENTSWFFPRSETRKYPYETTNKEPTGRSSFRSIRVTIRARARMWKIASFGSAGIEQRTFARPRSRAKSILVSLFIRHVGETTVHSSAIRVGQFAALYYSSCWNRALRASVQRTRRFRDSTRFFPLIELLRRMGLVLAPYASARSFLIWESESRRSDTSHVSMIDICVWIFFETLEMILRDHIHNAKWVPHIVLFTCTIKRKLEHYCAISNIGKNVILFWFRDLISRHLHDPQLLHDATIAQLIISRWLYWYFSWYMNVYTRI